MKPFYITTTLPYVNGLPHVGHTVEFIRSDMIARFQRGCGRDVFFNTGVDEHGIKNWEKSQELGITTQEYVDQMASQWVDFCQMISMSNDAFTRTTADQQKKGAQHIWKLCQEAGYIQKKHYQSKYCVGCELEKTDSELNSDGRCPDHANRDIEYIDEENYFFTFSAFAETLLELYRSNPRIVIPDFRLDEIQKFVQTGLHDFSISRPREKLAWGVSVPGDDSQVMYVWFDALTNYISALGWGSDDESLFEKFWTEGEVVQLCGKDNLRQQSAIWQAMLSAVGVKNTDTIFVEGHIISGGHKMSKSIGNVVNPIGYIDYYGIDAVRYFVARHVHNVQDSDWTVERFHETYMANLVNGLGNLVNRVLTMADSYDVHVDYVSMEPSPLLGQYLFNEELDRIWRMIGDADQFITDEAPFKKIKTDESAGREDIRFLLEKLHEINESLAPIMPTTYQKIASAMQENKKPTEPLFPRLECRTDM